MGGTKESCGYGFLALMSCMRRAYRRRAGGWATGSVGRRGIRITMTSRTADGHQPNSRHLFIMRSPSLATLLPAALVAAASLEERTTCSPDDRIAAVKKEIATIGSHTAADAATIPLAPFASRTFFVTSVSLFHRKTKPHTDERVCRQTQRSKRNIHPYQRRRHSFDRANTSTSLLHPLNLSSSDDLNIQLVVLATVLNADVPQGSDSYTVNANGSVTVDYIQTNRIALPQVDVREVHTFDLATCRTERIVGFVFGPLTSFTGGIELS